MQLYIFSVTVQQDDSQTHPSILPPPYTPIFNIMWLILILKQYQFNYYYYYNILMSSQVSSNYLDLVRLVYIWHTFYNVITSFNFYTCNHIDITIIDLLIICDYNMVLFCKVFYSIMEAAITRISTH